MSLRLAKEALFCNLLIRDSLRRPLQRKKGTLVSGFVTRPVQRASAAGRSFVEGSVLT